MAQTSENSASQVQHLKTDILLVTATEIEARTVLSLFQKETGYKPKQYYIGNKTYHELGVLGGAKTVMIQSEMGTGGPSGAFLAVYEALMVLSPSTAVMVGIAFGVDSTKQKIGDILVSRQLLAYEHQRVGSDSDGQVEIILRGDRSQASPRVLDRFRSGVFDWMGPKVQFGLILSGDKLIDNRGFLNQLLQLEPEAIGGEMEGAALYATAQRDKVDWIVVKAISDWADGSKEQEDKETRQKEAAENVVRFAIHVLRQGGFSDSGIYKAQSREATSKLASSLSATLGTTLLSYKNHSHWVLALDWEPNGTRIVSAGSDATAQVWNADTGQLLSIYREHIFTGFLGKTKLTPSIYNVAWSPKGTRIASSGTGKNVHVWQADSGGTLLVYKEHSGLLPYVFALAWSPDGTRIASACSSAGIDKTIRIWNVKTGRTVLRCDTHLGMALNFSMLALAWSPDGTRIAATCGDKTIRIWDASTGQPLATYKVHTDMVSDLAWSPDSKFLAIANPDATAQIWDTSTGQLLLNYSGHSDSVRSVAWSPDGASIASASNDNTVQIWDAATGNHIYTYRGHSAWTTSVAWSPDGTRIASGSNDKTVQIWQAR